jgi:hypothetical protein
MMRTLLQEVYPSVPLKANTSMASRNLFLWQRCGLVCRHELYMQDLSKVAVKHQPGERLASMSREAAKLARDIQHLSLTYGLPLNFYKGAVPASYILTSVNYIM